MMQSRGELSKLICLCEIAGAHALRGEVRIRSFTGDPLAIADYGPLRDEAGRSFTVVSAKPGPKGVIVQLAGVTTRETAEALSGTALYVAREALPDAKADEWYHADLVGLRAIGPDAEPLGEVVAVHNFGAGDIIELERKDETQTVLVPFTQATVIEVDLSAGVIRLAPPEVGHD